MNGLGVQAGMSGELSPAGKVLAGMRTAIFAFDPEISTVLNGSDVPAALGQKISRASNSSTLGIAGHAEQDLVANQPVYQLGAVSGKPAVRFDGALTSLHGDFSSTVSGGWMLAIFYLVGGGGENNGRLFTINETGEADSASTGWITGMRAGTDVVGYYSGLSRTSIAYGAASPIIYHSRATLAGMVSTLNGSTDSDAVTSVSMAADEFNIGANQTGAANVGMDLEHVAYFPASVTPEAFQAHLDNVMAFKGVTL